MKKKALFIVLIILLVGFLTSCNEVNKDNYAISKQSYYMYLDTISTVSVEYNVNEKTKDTVAKELNVIHNILFDIEKEFSIEQTLYMMNKGIVESTLMKVNKASGINSVEVSDEFLEVFEKAKEIYDLSNGGFNPTIGPLTKLWDISGRVNQNIQSIPTSQEIDAYLSLVDFDKVEINKENKTVFLKTKGMSLDFGAIAKGYACDKVMEYLKPLGYTYISVNLGGNLFVWGSSKIYESEGRKVGTEIQNPLDPATTIIRTEETNMTVVTSGIYERYIEFNGKKYHHILDPKTGYPFENELLMVTIIGSNSCICDGLSTGIFSLGLEQGIETIKQLDGYSAFFVTKNNEIYSVGNIEFELTTTGKNNYKLINVE